MSTLLSLTKSNVAKTKDNSGNKRLQLYCDRGLLFWLSLNCSLWQLSFRKTGTMGTLASHAKIGVWVQAPGGASAGVRYGGITARKKVQMYMKYPAI